MAEDGAVLSLEAFQDFPSQGIGLSLGGRVLQIAAAVQEADEGYSTADGTAGSLHIAAAQSEALSDFKQMLRCHIN